MSFIKNKLRRILRDSRRINGMIIDNQKIEVGDMDLDRILIEHDKQEERIDLLEAAINSAIKQFSFYEQAHLEKGTEEGNKKAKTNGDMANKLKLVVQSRI